MKKYGFNLVSKLTGNEIALLVDVKSEDIELAKQRFNLSPEDLEIKIVEIREL